MCSCLGAIVRCFRKEEDASKREERTLSLLVRHARLVLSDERQKNVAKKGGREN